MATETGKLTKKEQKRIAEIAELKSGLNSSEKVLVLKALDKLAKKGDASLLPDMIELWRTEEDFEIMNKVQKLFNSLKDPAIVAPMLKTIEAEKNTGKLRPMLLSALWQANLPVQGHFKDLTRILLASDYAAAVEIYSIFDNTSHPESDEVLQACIDEIHRGTNKAMEEIKPLLAEITALLESKKST